MEEEDQADAPLDLETTCSICYAEFLEADDLATHVKQVHWTESCRQCQFCPSVFTSLDHYALHLRDCHVVTLVMCKYCQKVFNDREVLQQHEAKHVDRIYKTKHCCSQCTTKFSKLHDLHQHELEYHNNSFDGVFLDEVNSLLSEKLKMKASTFINSLRENLKLVCTICMFSSRRPSDYINHLSTNKCNCYVCDKCCNVYKERRGLYKHLENHKECFHQPNDIDLKKCCPKCQNIIEIAGFTEHVASCKPLRCNLCQKITESVNELSQHQALEHPMAIQMKMCELCQSEFVGSTALQRHFDRKHKAEIHLYKYKCVYCNTFYFKHPQKLFNHLFSKHPDITPFCCKICNLTFKLRKKFTIHIKLVHNSVGFVEFDENYHVSFADTKSPDAFTPTCLFPHLLPKDKDQVADTDAEDTIQTDAPTDVPTDAEEKKKSEKKHPKLRYKEKNKVPVKSDPNQSEAEKNSKTIKGKTRKQLKRKVKASGNEPVASSDSDQPLLKIKRSSQTIAKRNNIGVKVGTRKTKKNRARLTCKLCKKYCYTFLNYNHHMSLHFKNQVKKCIKCGQEFKSKHALNDHIAEKHSSSKLTDTLKWLLNRRKMTKDGTLPDLTPSEKFRKTIKRVKTDKQTQSVTIKEIDDKLSVQKFIEEFTPEEMNKESKRKDLDLNTISVTVKTVKNAYVRPPSIKINKFIPKPPPSNIKLSMPVRFKEVPSEKPKVHIRFIQAPQPAMHEEHDYDHGDDNVQSDENAHYNEENDGKNDTVPEVAEEVMLETQEQQKPQIIIPQKIVLPKLPSNYTSDDIRIAHLLPEAPFFKIVKMSEVLKQSETQTDQSTKEKEEEVSLPMGTKLVNVNPLAHLLGDTPVEKILGAKKSYYKPKKENVKDAVTKALLKLEKQPVSKRARKNKNTAEN